ncbi:DUF5134 domain-containing protein [Streptomyces iconiensis]|uniref:DUF5134 domain-containing protein n=1 Tax=Streptomyces iconiensis TaxID=1384038 RepID=A0ABT7A7F9_9ACTN|nr:DUF5134 domain-containing protein [Streptomyces iconiensis]MDJ1137269.1 DUF5134 domain-containing protein [Streptomyces iconiensis]
MHGPATVGWLLVALCALTGAYCVLRAKGTDGARREDAGGEALMGFGMAAMAVPSVWTWQPLPPAVTAAAFAALFTALLARELGLLLLRWRRDGRRGARPCVHLHHVTGALAMAYMSLAMAAAFAGTGGAAGPAAHGTGTGGIPVLTGALLVYFAGYALWNGAQLIPSPAGAPATAGAGAGVAFGPACAVIHQPGVTAGCRLAMSTAMFTMLLTL